MTWSPPEGPPQLQAEALLSSVKGRKDLKRLGKWLETHGGDLLKLAVVTVARKRGVELPDEAVHWPGKRLLRRSLGRAEEAQRRTNPIARDEAFTCVYCSKAVQPHGRTARDHCPHCLRSLHVDVVPGDRAATCGGRLDPYDVVVQTRGVLIRYRCTRCGETKVNRAVLDGEVPDDWDVLVRLSSGTLG
jgi:DNA-directed RNA polymerase subunit RPC12/RpoP